MTDLMLTPITLGALEDAIAEEIKMVLVVGAVIGVTAIVSITGLMRRASVTRQREQTKREIAAYIAEGSMTPEDAHKILAAGETDDLRELILKRAADGWISAKKAQQILAAMDKGKPA